MILIDPFSSVTPYPDAYNPLEFLDPEADTIVEDIGVIAEALILSEADGRNEHFTSGAKSLIAGYIAQAISDPEIRNPSLFTVYDMLLQLPEDHHRLHARMAMNDRAGGVAKRTALRVLQGGATNEFRSVQATALEQTNWIASPGMRKVLDRSTFRMEELRGDERLHRLPADATEAQRTAWEERRGSSSRSGASLYLVIPPQFIDVHKRFIRLFVNTAISRFVAAGRAPFPTLFLIDEAHSLGTMKEVSRGYGLLAGYNMFLWTFFQDKGQLDRLYGSEAESFISSSRATQVFGVTDDTTVNFVSNQLGKRTLKRGTFLRDTEAVDLRSPGDVRLDIERDMNRQYVLRNGRTPLILERVPYFKSTSFLAEAGTDPDYPRLTLTAVLAHLPAVSPQVPLSILSVVAGIGLLGTGFLVVLSNISAIFSDFNIGFIFMAVLYWSFCAGLVKFGEENIRRTVRERLTAPL